MATARRVGNGCTCVGKRATVSRQIANWASFSVLGSFWPLMNCKRRGDPWHLKYWRLRHGADCVDRLDVQLTG